MSGGITVNEIISVAGCSSLKLHNVLGFQSRVRGFETYSGYIYFQMQSRLTCVSSFSQNEKKSNKYWQSRKNTKRKIICKLGLMKVY